MAAIKNAIDNILQAANPRIVQSALPPNIIVSGGNLSAGVGKNLLPNAGFYLGFDKWIYTPGFGLNLPSWSLSAIQSTAWFGGAYAQGTGDANLYLPAASRIPCSQGQIVEVSAYVAAHRCTCAIGVEFFNSAGVSIGFGQGISSDHQNTGTKLGGVTLEGYKRCYVFSSAPAGAASAGFAFNKGFTDQGQTSSYGFITLPFLGIAGANQAELSPWSDGIGVQTTIISASNYSTYMAQGAVSGMAYAVSAGSSTTTKSVSINFNSDGQNVIIHLAVWLSSRINEGAGGTCSVSVSLKTNGTLQYTHALGDIPNSTTANAINLRLSTTMYIPSPGAGTVTYLAEFVPFFGGTGTAGYISQAEIEIIGLKR